MHPRVLLLLQATLLALASSPAYAAPAQCGCKDIVITPSEQSCLLGHLLEIITHLVHNQQQPLKCVEPPVIVEPEPEPPVIVEPEPEPPVIVEPEPECPVTIEPQPEPEPEPPVTIEPQPEPEEELTESAPEDSEEGPESGSYDEEEHEEPEPSPSEEPLEPESSSPESSPETSSPESSSSQEPESSPESESSSPESSSLSSEELLPLPPQPLPDDHSSSVSPQLFPSPPEGEEPYDGPEGSPAPSLIPAGLEHYKPETLFIPVIKFQGSPCLNADELREYIFNMVNKCPRHP